MYGDTTSVGHGRRIAALLSVLHLAYGVTAQAQDTLRATDPLEFSWMGDADTETPGSHGAPQGAGTSPEATEAPTSGEGTPAATNDASEDPASKPTTRPTSRFVEEIVVTAQKREENLQDVPISVQAFSGDMLNARGITDQRELQLVTPGLDVGTQVGYTTVFLRGVGSDAFVTADPSVALYIDGVYFPFAQGLAQNFGAVERVEVLKGPQGTLFGRNAVGGAINVITQSPHFEEDETSVQVSYANFDDLQSRIHTNLPITDTLAMSVSALYNTAEYYMDGVAGGRPLDRETSRGARAKVAWAPTDTLDISFAAFHLLVGGVGSIFQLNSDPSALFAPVIEPQSGYKGEVDADSFTRIDNRVYYGQIKYGAPWFDVKLLGSDQRIDTTGTYDFDGSPVPLVEFSPKSQFADVQTAEIQLISNSDSWGSDWLTWIAGGYYFRGDQGFDPLYLQAAGLNLGAGTIGGIQLPPALLGATDSLFGLLADNLGAGVPAGTLYLVATVGTESTSGFFQVTADVMEWLAVTLGGRYQVESRDIIESSSALADSSGNRIEPGLFNFDGARDQNGNAVPPHSTTRSFNPKVSLDLRPFGDDTLLYVSYQKATKSATFNALAIYLQPSFVRPEETTAYEIGIKTRLFDDLLTFNAAAFLYDTRDLQVQFISLLQGGAIAFENAPRARSQGFDFDATAIVLPSLFDDLVFTLGGAYLDATYTDFPEGTGFNEAGLYSQNNDYTGNDIIRSPRFTGSTSLAKTWPIPGGTLELAGDGYYNSGFFYAASNSRRSEQPEYSVFGGRVSYLYEPWNLRLTLFGKNLGNRQYTTGSLPTDFGNLVTLAPPRTYGLRINWDF